MLKLQMAHLVHQREQTSQFSRVVTYAQEACAILRDIMAPIPRPSIGKPASPVAGRKQVARKAPAKRQAPATRAARGMPRVAKTAGTLPVTPRSRKCECSATVGFSQTHFYRDFKAISHTYVVPLPRLSFGRPVVFENVAGLLDILRKGQSISIPSVRLI